MKRASLFVMAASVAMLLPLSVQAATFVLGPATYINSGYVVRAYGAGYTTTPTGPGLINQTANSIDQVNHPGTATGILDIKAAPFPSISASASSSGNGDAAMTGSLSYQFQILGSAPYDPAHPVYVPTIVTFKGGVSTTSPTGNNVGATSHFNIAGDNFAESYTVVGGAFPSALHTINGFSQPFSGSSFDEQTTYSIIADAYYHIDILATAVSSGLGTANAFIDPFIEIDPTFADAAKYRIILSEGISNIGGSVPVAAVPVPASLPLFGAGILGLAVLGYRSRGKPTPNVYA